MKNKFQLLLIIGCLTVLVVAVGFLNVSRVQASVTYPVPHQSWLKTGVVSYQPSMTDAQIDWAASHIDWFDNPHSDSSMILQRLKVKTDAPMLRYVEYVTVDEQDSWVMGAMQSYASAHGGNIENMFIHTADGNRVPWRGDWAGNRRFTNPGSALYQGFLKEFMLSSLAVTGSPGYDGVFIDDAAPRMLINNSDGLPLTEYPGDAETANTAYDNDLVKCYGAVASVYGPANKAQVVNLGDYNYPNVYPHVNGVFYETLFSVGSIGDRWYGMSRLGEANNQGVYNVVGFSGLNDSNSQIESLAAFYIGANPSVDYFWARGTYSGDLQTEQWFEALGSSAGNVGQPLGTYSSPANWSMRRDYQNAIVLLNLNGSSYTYSLPAGNYYPLQADGTLGPAISGSFTLADEQGAILMKSNPAPSMTKSVDKTSAVSGTTLTYTINYTNPSSTTLFNTKIEDNIPTGTSYVNGSATGGATFDSANNKIILNIGNLSAGANGGITFKVKIL